MSLVAWYPLNGDTNDYSGNGHILNNITATVNSSGKIGSCYSFASGQVIGASTGFTFRPTMSFAGWGIASSLSSTMLFSCNSPSMSGADIFFASSTISWNSGDGTVNTFKKDGVNVVLPSLNVWHHYIVVNDATKNKAYLYIDGNYYGEANYLNTTQINRGFTIGNYYPGATAYAWAGRINDIRVYDHALSLKEIKEISKAKILHYTFDDFQEPTTNLSLYPDYSNRTYNNAYTANSWGGDVATITYYANGGYNNLPYKRLTKTVGGSGGSYLDDNGTFTLLANTTYTMSVYMKASTDITLDGYAASINRSADNLYITSITPVLNTEWKRIVTTFTTSSTQNGIYTTRQIIYVDNNLPISIYWSGFQIEKLDHATPYVKGTREGIIKDTSGYQRDAILSSAASPQWVNDSKIGTGAYKFLSGKNFRTNFTIIPEKFTVNFWANFGEYSYMQVANTSDTQFCFKWRVSGNYPYWNIFDSSNAYYSIQYNSIPALNEWHMYTLTYDGSYQKIYLDGVLHQSTNIGLKNFSQITYFESSFPNGEVLKGYMDDTRIYATALSSDDVLELYHTRACLDNHGNLSSTQFIENIEPTVNLIPNPTKNAYPTFGNSHGTYDTDQYNNDVYFSIGTVDNVTNNIVTLSAIGHSIYTYDALKPQTSGGGLTAGVTYFIKKISANTFSIHTYNSSEDGSQGYINTATGKFKVHDSIALDQRISINATNFPTMWKANPHIANSGLVKEVIVNGFNKDGIIHDCLRLHKEHKTQKNSDVSYMAYGVLPQVITGRTYTFSFYCRAVNAFSVGKTISLSMWTSTGWPNAKSFTMTSEWQKCVLTSIAPSTGGTNMYFSQPGLTTFDIAEIQCEEKSYNTAFIADRRIQPDNIATDFLYDSNSIMKRGICNFERFSEVGITQGLVAYYPMNGNPNDYSGNNNHATEYNPEIVEGLHQTCYNFNGTDKYLMIPMTANSIIRPTSAIAVSVWAYKLNWDVTSSERMVSCTEGGGWNVGLNDVVGYVAVPCYIAGVGYKTIKYARGLVSSGWHFISFTFDGTNLKLYIDGELRDTVLAGGTSISYTSNATFIGAEATSGIINGGSFWNGKIQDVRIYNRALTTQEIKTQYDLTKESFNVMKVLSDQIYVSGNLKEG